MRHVGGEVVAGVDDHPLAAELLAGVHVPEEIALDAVANVRRVFGHVDRRHRVDADMDAVPVADFADAFDALGGERFDGVRCDVDLEVQVADAVLDGGREAVLDLVALAEIDADALAHGHGNSPPILAGVTRGLSSGGCGACFRFRDRHAASPEPVVTLSALRAVVRHCQQ
jgi:hypothetical protein